MRAAPPVEYPVARAGFGRYAAAALSACTAATFALWLALWQEAPPSAALQAAIVTLAGGVAWVAAWRASSRQAVDLRWTGSDWQLRPCENGDDWIGPGRVETMLDLGSWMLLRWTAAGERQRSARWIDVARRDAPTAWRGLRVAVLQRPAEP